MSLAAFFTKLNRRSTPLFPQLSKRSKSLLTVLFVVGLFVTGNILAQDLYKDKREAIKEGTNQESWLDEAFSTNVIIVEKALFNEETEAPQPDTGGSLRTPGTVSIVRTGVLPTTTNVIAALYDPPASGIEYIAQMKNSLLGKPAYAQSGVGFIGLQPILPLWRGFRNIVYLLSSVVFVVLGIMIMLRIKISPQAVVTIQSSIPNFITTLVLVTFSYAIAGLLIDLMYLVQSIALSTLFAVMGKSLTDNLIEPLLTFNPVTDLSIPGFMRVFLDHTILKPFDFNNLAEPTMTDVIRLVQVPSNYLSLFSGFIAAIIGGFIGLVAYVPGSVVGAAVSFTISYVIVKIILFVLILIWLFQFLIGAIKAYVTIIFKIIVAPLEIGLGAFPNMKIGFNTWVWELIANLAIFPVSVLILVISGLVIQQTLGSAALWVPSLFGFRILGYGVSLPAGGLVPAAVALSTLLLLSKLPEAIPQFIFSIKPSPWGQSASQTAGGIVPGFVGVVSKPFAVGRTAASAYRDYQTVTGGDKKETTPEAGSSQDRARKAAEPVEEHGTPDTNAEVPRN